MYKKKKIALVIPCYKVSNLINQVIKSIPSFVDKIYVIDDKCPENSVGCIKSKSRKIIKIFRNINGGVGAAVKDGYRFSLRDNNHITIRIDGDGQMDLKLIKLFIDPIIEKKVEFLKGNRFMDLNFLKNMPFLRIVGNILFSIIGNLMTKNIKIFDFLNGYTSINNNALRKVLRKNLDDDYFFDTILIYQLSKLKIKILDVPMKAKYENEISNINILITGSSILYKNLVFFLGIKK
ncbi:glycosyltransferase family 2 protein [Candidatus Pelagibacter sp.]|nr:glycosyltransferase family 2 protein [Candidatus Pelagibacter sp.]|tara:strand:+ start:2136 stop:2843 length:708 start_codon:yes stop_codon:yes gene_type:complete